MRTEDGCIIQECLDGEPEAFGVLVDKYKAGIYAYNYAKLRDFHDAQDVAQEVFLQAYRNLHKLRRWESFPFWLYRIASNSCKKWLQSKSRRPDGEFIEDQNDVIISEYSICLHREQDMASSLQEALNLLSETHRETLMLYYFGDMNSVDIARSLGTSPTAIRHRLSRARIKLREEMVAMMDSTFAEKKLNANFTFNILKAIKQIRPQPIPRMTALPLGLSLAAGIIFVAVMLSPYAGIFGSANMGGFEAADLDMLPQMRDFSEDDDSDLQSVILMTSTAELDISAKDEEESTISINIPRLSQNVKQLEMVLIQPGTFIMGSRNGESQAWPPHKVTITRPFYIGKYEVTQAQWQAVMGKNRSYFSGHPDRPVEKVSWRDCQKFIKRLKNLNQGKFRLPTEAEWEYACRADTDTPFSFGSDARNAEKYMWWRGNNEPDETKKVGMKRPNSWGIYDMHGNVYEWCADRWESSHERDAQIDPKVSRSRWALFGFVTKYVFRGGCFNSQENACRSASRRNEQAFDYYKGLGLRLVREFP